MRSGDALSARRPSVGRFAAGKADGRTIERGGGGDKSVGDLMWEGKGNLVTLFFLDLIRA